MEGEMAEEGAAGESREAEESSEEGELPEAAVTRRLAVHVTSRSVSCVVADVEPADSCVVRVCFSSVCRLPSPAHAAAFTALRSFARRGAALGATGAFVLLCGAAPARAAAEVGLPAAEARGGEARLCARVAGGGTCWRQEEGCEIFGGGGETHADEASVEAAEAAYAAATNSTSTSTSTSTAAAATTTAAASAAAANSTSSSSTSTSTTSTSSTAAATTTSTSTAAAASASAAAAARVESLAARLRAAMAPPPGWLAGAHVTAIGDEYSPFAAASALAADACQRPCADFDGAELRRALLACGECTDAQLGARIGVEEDEARLVVPKLALILAVMDHCRMARVSFEPTPGLCLGIVTTNSYYEVPE